VHPDLGTLADFDRLVERRRSRASRSLSTWPPVLARSPLGHRPPDWFRRLPDGTIRTGREPAEAVRGHLPARFQTPDWRRLWDALRDVVEILDRPWRPGVPGDNPTPSRCASGSGSSPRPVRHPRVIMLAEAFTRPRIMEHLPRWLCPVVHRYFTWRTTAQSFEEYLTELTRTPTATTSVPTSGRTPRTSSTSPSSAGAGRPSSHGSCSPQPWPRATDLRPSFELVEHEPRHPGSESNLDSEKYEVRHLGPRPSRQPRRPGGPGEHHPPRVPRLSSRIARCGSTTSTTTTSSSTRRRAMAAPAETVAPVRSSWFVNPRS